MCMEDIRIGRNSTTKITRIALANGVDSDLCGVNVNRIALSIYTDAAFAALVTPTVDGLTGSGGMSIPTGMPHLVLRVEDIGNGITQRWIGRGSGGAVNVTVFETVYAGNQPPE